MKIYFQIAPNSDFVGDTQTFEVTLPSGKKFLITELDSVTLEVLKVEDVNVASAAGLAPVDMCIRPRSDGCVEVA